MQKHDHYESGQIRIGYVPSCPGEGYGADQVNTGIEGRKRLRSPPRYEQLKESNRLSKAGKMEEPHVP
ncbi:hypothetical protein Avbf_14408 [Armadillidium vulgare]|nr:hypothetical protein Avbf_14408 [Armadillidium vulgare]